MPDQDALKLRQASMTTCEPRAAEGCAVIQGPCPMYAPSDKYRVPEQIAGDVREVIRGVTAGNLPWPLLFAGDVGSGKTCAGLCMIDRYGGWYITLGDLLSMLIEAQNDRLAWVTGHKRTVRDIWDAWGEANLVVLDEVGARGEVSDHHYENLKRAIDLREGRPAVFVSNLDLQGLATAYDDRIASRLAAGTLVRFTGDRRISRSPRGRRRSTRY